MAEINAYSCDAAGFGDSPRKSCVIHIPGCACQADRPPSHRAAPYRQSYSHCGAVGAGANFHEAAECPNAFPRPGDSDTRQRRASVQLLEKLLGYAAAVVGDLEEESAALPAENDFGCRTARVPFNIGERFLCDAKQGRFRIGGEPAQPAGEIETDLRTEPPVKTIDIGPERGAQSSLFQQWRLDQVGKFAKIIAAFVHQL